ncbi:MAG: hypothetical protein H0W17_08540 [Chloroflexi bacterium]|nr:hypothetical protein [Chloroflexota bacterium]
MSATTDPAWGWGKSATDVYAGGMAWGGAAPATWEPYQDGSDLAFRTYVSTGAPVCDLAAAVPPDGDLVDGAIDVAVGAELDLYGFDFGSMTEVTLEFLAPDGATETFTSAPDIFGDFDGIAVFEDADIGAWQLTAYPTADPTCVDSVDVNVLAASVPPSPPAPTPTPTPGTLPDTSTDAPPADLSWAALALLAMAIGSLAARRVLSPRRGAQYVASRDRR